MLARSAATLLSLSLVFAAQAQEKASPAPAEKNDETFRQDTLLASGEMPTLGGAGGIRLHSSSVDGRDAWFFGGSGGIIINHYLELGGGGYGMTNRVLLSPADGRRRRLNFGYAGFMAALTPMSDAIVHPRVELLLGAGGVSASYEDDDMKKDMKDDHESGKAFFVMEPSLQAEVNVHTFVRLYVGGSWRYLRGSGRLDEIDAKALSRPAVHVGLRFGLF